MDRQIIQTIILIVSANRKLLTKMFPTYLDHQEPIRTDHGERSEIIQHGLSLNFDTLLRCDVNDVIGQKPTVTHNVSHRVKSDESLIKPYSTAHLLSFRYRNMQGLQDADNTEGSFAGQDLPRMDPNTEPRSCTTPTNDETSDSQLSTSPASSISSGNNTPPSRSTSSSPDSGCGSASSPEVDVEPVKRKARTNYTPEQIKTLEKIFFGNPYPDSEHMETISKDLEVPENKIKIWFQNKRARWRRRVNATATSNSPQLQMPVMTSAMPQFLPYNYMTYPSPLRTSQYVPGYQPGMYNSPTNYQMPGLATPTTQESFHNQPQWQQYQRNYQAIQQQHHMMSSQQMTSYNQGLASANHRILQASRAGLYS